MKSKQRAKGGMSIPGNVFLWAFFTLLLAGCGGREAVAAAPGDAETSRTVALDRVLEQAGVSREDLRPDPLLILADMGQRRPLAMLRAVQADPLGAPYRVGLLEQRFRGRLDSPHRLFLYTASLTDADIARGYIGNPLETIDRRLLSAGDPLAEAMKMLEEVSRPFEWKEKLPPMEELGGQSRHEFARLVAAIASAEQFRRRAFRNVPPEINPDMLLEQIMLSRFRDFDGPDYRVYLQDIEWEALHAGMLDLVAAMEDFDDFAPSFTSTIMIPWRIETPLGEVILAPGPTTDSHASASPLLVVDMAGDDSFFLDDMRTGRTGISIVYDRAGNDRHWIEPGKGSAAILGYGITWDCTGDDEYTGNYLSQASALLGAALHHDGAGNDTYKATANSQAWSVGGAALLVDLGGIDTFTSLVSSQASAGPMAAAVLLNEGGDDAYTLGNDPLIDPSPQSSKHNSSMGQGAGSGVRADLSDGRSLPGGFGMLIDTGGNDVYSAQVFCQGVGYLEGVGILVDGGGDDRYTGEWYAQASAAHRSAGVLLDRGGNDSYAAAQYTSIAVGHDLSTGILVDEGGDDSYAVKNLWLGAGNDNGFGMLVDGSGDDRYTIEAGEGYGLGAAKIVNWGTQRESASGIGLFLDLAGTDVYAVRRDGPADGAAWAWPRKLAEPRLRSESGGGIDGVYPMPFRTTAWTEGTGEDEKMLREARAARRAYRKKWSK